MHSTKKLAIIISFSYIGTNKHLPGSVIDLYIANKYFTQNGFDTYAITDFDCNYPNYDIIASTAVRKGTVCEDICDLWKNEKFSFKTDIVTGLVNILKSACTEHVCLYFSGHTFKKEIYTTDVNKIPTSVITDLIKIENQLWIFDSCYCDILLKYKFDGKNLTVHTTNFERDDKQENVTAIVSSESTERSYSTNIGSFFTRYFFSFLASYKIKNVSYISEYVAAMISERNAGYDQSVCFFSSQPMLVASLPEWL